MHSSAQSLLQAAFPGCTLETPAYTDEGRVMHTLVPPAGSELDMSVIEYGVHQLHKFAVLVVAYHHACRSSAE